MLTKEDLQQLGDLIDKKLDAKLEPIREDIKIVDTKIEAFNHKLDATAKETKETIEREVKVIADTFLDTFEKLDKQEQLEKRLERVEKRLDL